MRIYHEATASGPAGSPHALAAELSPVPLWLVDADGHCVWCNAAFMRFTGWQPGATDFRTWWAERIYQDDAQRVMPVVREAKAAGRPHEVTYRFRAADGRDHRVLQRAAPVYGSEGEFQGYTGTVLDLDDLEASGHDEPPGLASSAHADFLALLSHELAGPVTSVLGFAHRLSSAGSDDERTEAASAIYREAERLKGVIENMQALARAERGYAPLEPLHLPHVLAALAEDLAHRLHCTLHADIPGDLPPVLANRTWLDQILTNLVANAAKYGGPASGIDIEARAEGDAVVVSVLDRGPGIDQAEAEQIFEPFYRSPHTRAGVVGAGLGLAVCRELVALQQGRIWAGPREGGGAEVSFTLRTADLPAATAGNGG